MRAGFGVASITPEPPVFLAGFGGRTEPATSVLDPLEARAVFFEGDDTAVCLIVCDLLGMSPGYAIPAREAVASALGLSLNRVLISCTHTHQGPSAMAGTEALGWPNPEGLEDLIRDGCVTAATAARDGAAEATLRYGRFALPDGFAFNRRGGNFDGPWFAVLDVLAPDGTRIGTIANMHIHPVLLGPQWYAVATDWVGPFRRALETALGGTAIELTGALGDINPTPPDGPPGDDYAPWATADQTSDFGKRLADAVIALASETADLEPTLEVVRNETRDIAVGTTPIAMLLGEPSLKVEFIEWQLGDVRIVSIPGEAFHLLGREISSSRNDRVLLAGIAPAWHGYLPHPWGEGYEEGVSYGEEFVDAVKSALLEAP